MRKATTIEDFLARPVGQFVAGEHYLVWCASPTLAGSSHWGPITLKDAEELAALQPFLEHPLMARTLDLIVDARRVEDDSGQATAILERHILPLPGELRERIRLQIVLLPAATAAANSNNSSDGRTHLCGDREEAMRILGRDDAAFPLDEMERLGLELALVPPTVRRVRDYVEHELGRASLDTAAERLRVSRRSLQRYLGMAGTSFRDELFRARLARATRLLELTDDKVDAIARGVGCASTSHLGTLFRRHGLEAPSAYRHRIRRERGA